MALFTKIFVALSIFCLACVPQPRVDKSTHQELTLSFISNKCAIFEGSFDEKGFKKQQVGTIGEFSCRLIQGVGAKCTVRYRNVDDPTLDVQREFYGSFGEVKINETPLLLIEAKDEDGVTSRMYCGRDGCFALQTFDTDLQLGVQCINKDAEPKVEKQKTTIDL